jgi:hypothetical protein
MHLASQTARRLFHVHIGWMLVNELDSAPDVRATHSRRHAIGAADFQEDALVRCNTCDAFR